ncbi:Uncharacterised protein [uncultured archaeon]|nr:Uncharacterised protein [uncultured archaeon]
MEKRLRKKTKKEMRINEISPTMATYTGYFHQLIKQGLDAGKVPEEKEEERLKRKFDKEKESVQKIYDLKGKLIETNIFGRDVNITA